LRLRAKNVSVLNTRKEVIAAPPIYWCFILWMCSSRIYDSLLIASLFLQRKPLLNFPSKTAPQGEVVVAIVATEFYTPVATTRTNTS
jgi:hypothetical protein